MWKPSPGQREFLESIYDMGLITVLFAAIFGGWLFLHSEYGLVVIIALMSLVTIAASVLFIYSLMEMIREILYPLDKPMKGPHDDDYRYC